MLRDFVSGINIGTLHVENAREPVDIVVRLPREQRASPETLLGLRVTSPQGAQVPLSAIARVENVVAAKPVYDRYASIPWSWWAGNCCNQSR